jgi:hypothetical protein
MPGKILRLASCVLFAWVACGQTAADKTFYLAHTDTHGLQQIANVLRTMEDVRDVSVNEDKSSISIHGTAEQIAISGWLVGELDQVPGVAASSATHVYPGAISGGQLIHVYLLTGPQTPIDLQEITNSIRAVADVQRIFPYPALRCLAARGTPDQLALTDWMIGMLDGPAKPGTQASRPYVEPANGRNEVAQIYFLANTQTPQAIQEIINSTRSISDLQRVFPYNRARALTIRGSADQMALADWLLKELDQPGQTNADSGQHEYQVPATIYRGPTVARVFYLGSALQPQAVQDLVNAVRTETKMQRAYPVHQVNALAVLGTGDQVARAEQIVKERGQ